MTGLEKYEGHPSRTVNQFLDWAYCVEYYVIGTQNGQYIVVAHYQDDQRLALEKFEWHGYYKSPINAMQQCMDKIAEYYFNVLNGN